MVQIFNTPMMLILRRGRRHYCCLYCLYLLPIHRWWITGTKSLINYRTYKTTNRWCSIDVHYNVLSFQHLLPSIIIFIMFWTYWQSFWHIETEPSGKAEHSNILALFALTWLKSLLLAKKFFAPAIHLCINWYALATANHSPIIYL